MYACTVLMGTLMLINMVFIYIVYNIDASMVTARRLVLIPLLVNILYFTTHAYISVVCMISCILYDTILICGIIKPEQTGKLFTIIFEIIDSA